MNLYLVDMHDLQKGTSYTLGIYATPALAIAAASIVESKRLTSAIWRYEIDKTASQQAVCAPFQT